VPGDPLGACRLFDLRSLPWRWTRGGWCCLKRHFLVIPDGLDERQGSGRGLELQVSREPLGELLIGQDGTRPVSFLIEQSQQPLDTRFIVGGELD
jgi:hypothetical protein